MVRRAWILALLLSAEIVAQEKSWTVQVMRADGRPAAGSLSATGYGDRHELALDRNGIADLAAADIYKVSRYYVFARRGKLCTRFTRAPARGKQLRLTLEEGGVFVAAVRDNNGAPVADATVSLFAGGIPWFWPPLFSGRTNKDGAARIDGLPLGTPLHAVVTSYRGGLLLRIQKPKEARRWTKPGEEQAGDLRFEPPEGRVVRYRAECSKPAVDLPCQLTFHAVGNEKLSGWHQVRALPCDVPVFVPDGCPPLLFQLGLIGDQRATDMAPSAGGPVKPLYLSGESVVVVRVRDGAGRPLEFGPWHVRVWFLENGTSKRYPREAHAAAGAGLQVVKLPWPREMLALKRYALRFELRAGRPRSECYPWMPSAEEAPTIAGPELLRRMLGGRKWHVDLTVPVMRKPVFLARGPDGKPVAGVEIELLDEDGPILTMRSEKDGIARGDPPAGKVALAAVAKPPYYGRMHTGGGGFRGTGHVPFTVFRTRRFRIDAGTPSGPIEEGTDISLSGTLPGSEQWSASAEADATGKAMLDVPLALKEVEIDARAYAQSVTRPLQADQTSLKIDLLERVELWISVTGRADDESLHADVIDGASGEDVPTITTTSSAKPDAIGVTLPARPLRVVIQEGYNNRGRMAILEWDGKATAAHVKLAQPTLHKLHLEFVDPAGRPLPKLGIEGEWSGEGRHGPLKGVTDERGARTVAVVPGWVRVHVRVERADLVGPVYDTLRLQVRKESTLRVPLRWWQIVHLRLPAGKRGEDFRGKIAWRLGQGKWVALDGAPWQPDEDPDGPAKFGFAPGTAAGRIELRIRGEVYGFDYPGRPVEPPLFRIK